MRTITHIDNRYVKFAAREFPTESLYSSLLLPSYREQSALASAAGWLLSPGNDQVIVQARHKDALLRMELEIGREEALRFPIRNG
jgi:hypothetical protein